MTRHEPCFDDLLKVLRREPTDRPVLFEFFLNENLDRTLLGDRYRQRDGWNPLDAARNTVGAFAAAGYDYATIQGGWIFEFKHTGRDRAQTVSLNEGVSLQDRDGFDRYPWPDIAAVDFSLLDALDAELPRGMKLMVCAPGGVLENVIGLLGYDNLCFLLQDDPALADDVFDRVGETLLAFYRRAVTFRNVGVLMVNDDWGFKTQTMLTPDAMRRYVFPWHRQYVESAHKAGIPAVLHSCGQLESVMDDVIDDMRFDGKHSYEDAILPVEQAYARWGSRIAILGGLDVDFVVRSTPDAIYQRARNMLAAAPSGYALGTGNSVPDYVPNEHYFAMIRAATEAW
jgi:uroporphyrinogen decarboxylase